MLIYRTVIGVISQLISIWVYLFRNRLGKFLVSVQNIKKKNATSSHAMPCHRWAACITCVKLTPKHTNWKSNDRLNEYRIKTQRQNFNFQSKKIGMIVMFKSPHNSSKFLFIILNHHPCDEFKLFNVVSTEPFIFVECRFIQCNPYKIQIHTCERIWSCACCFQDWTKCCWYNVYCAHNIRFVMKWKEWTQKNYLYL